MAPQNQTLGSDLRTMDFQSAYDNSEPAYVSVLQKLYGVNKCASEMTKDDLLKHDQDTRTFLNDRSQGDIRKLGFLFGVGNEDREGELLGPTERIVMVDQMKRTICGDRFWFTNGFALNESKY